MTEQLRIRLDKDLIAKGGRVLSDIGLTPTQAVAVFYTRLVKMGRMPFPLSANPVLDEYGVTEDEADRAIAKAMQEVEADDKAGQLVEFKGKLP